MTKGSSAGTGLPSFLDGKIGFFSQCPVCESESLDSLYEFDTIHVKQCRDCKMRVLSPYLTPDAQAEVFSDTDKLREINAFLADYHEDETWTTPRTRKIYQDCLKAIEKYYPAPGSVLDVGCGKGAFLRQAKDAGWKAFGMEPSEKICDYLSEQGIHALSRDFTQPVAGESWDVIALWDLIEHVPDPARWIDNIREQLNPGGLTLIATPNHRSFLDIISDLAYRLSGGRMNQGIRKLYTIDHTLYLTDKSLGRLLENGGFRIVEVKRVNTDLSRYPMGAAFRIFSEILLAISSMLGLENRVIMLAQKKEGF